MFSSTAAMFTKGLPASTSMVFKGAAIGTRAALATVAIPAHTAGDIILLFAFDGVGAGTTIPAPATGGTVPHWFDITGGGPATYKFMFAAATANDHTSGVWSTGASNIIVAVAVLGPNTGIGSGWAAASFNTAGTVLSVPIPYITPLSNTTGSSAIVQFGATNSAAGASITPSAGYTSRASGGGLIVATKNVTTSDGSTTFVPSVLTPAMGVQVEILK